MTKLIFPNSHKKTPVDEREFLFIKRFFYD